MLDPFLGSGQVAVVSKIEGRRYIGFEIAKEYFDFAQERLVSGRYRLDADDKIPDIREEYQDTLFPIAINDKDGHS